jgi:Plavaka transposase
VEEAGVSEVLYHKCLEIIFSPFKPYMEKAKVIRCPDGHLCHEIFSLGPYIADYPEQVWLSGVVSNWCPKYVSVMFYCPVTV